MQKIKIRLPATLTDFTPAYQSLGLAISLYNHVEILRRNDEQVTVETDGEGAGHYALGSRHPVVLGMKQIYQQQDRALSGITIRVQNEIPIDCGLGAEDASMVAGMIGAYNLLSKDFSRAELIDVVAQNSMRPDAAMASMLGGLCATARLNDEVVYRSLPLTSCRVILAVPEIKDYERPTLPESINTSRMIQQTQRIPLILDAFRDANLELLSKLLDDKLLDEPIQTEIKGYAHIVKAAKQAGAYGVTTSGGGPAMIFFAEKTHDEVAAAIKTAFDSMNTSALIRVLPLDTQGIVTSIMQSSS